MTFLKAATSDIQKSILARNPCVCVTTALIIGIVTFRSYPINLSNDFLIAALCVCSLLSIALAHFLKNLHIEILILWFCVVGYVNSALHKQHYSISPENEIVVGKIISNCEEKPKTYKTTIEILNEGKPCLAIVYIQKDSLSQNLQYGDIISLNNTFHLIENQSNSTFDYKGFLANQNIYSQAYVTSTQWEFIGHKNSIFSHCMKLRTNALNKLKDLGLTEKNHQLIAALAFGDKSLLDEDTKGNFQTAGAMHILAVSGLHVGIINGILFFIFGFIRKRKFLWIKITCCIVGIWAYACITGMSPSVQRASIMCSMISISLLLKRNTSTYNSLASAAFFSLLISPNDLFSVSFQLSYAAVLSIVYFGKFIQKVFVPTTPIGEYLWGIIAVSISVQIGTTPLTLFYFGTIPTYSLLTNIVVIPLSFVILIGVVISLSICWIPTIAKATIQIVNFATDYLQDCIYDITTFPNAQINIQLSFRQSCIIYLCIMLFIIFFEIWNRLQIQKNLCRF